MSTLKCIAMDCYKNSDNCQMCCILFISSVHMMHCGRSMMPRSYRLLRRQDCVFSQTSGPHCCMETLITSHTCNPSLTRFVDNNYYKPSNMTISLGAIHQSPFSLGKIFHVFVVLKFRLSFSMVSIFQV